VTISVLLLVGGVAHGQEQAGRVFTLRGMVIDTAHLPVPDALVYLSGAGIFSVSDDEGWFTLSDADARADTLHVRGRGFLPSSFRVTVPQAVDDTIDVGPIALSPGPLPTLALTATVNDTLRGGPVVGAEVLLNDHVVGETDTAGMFSAADLPVEWGINVVLVRQPGYAPLISSLWVVEPHAHEWLTGIMQPQAVDLPAVVVEADRIRLSFDRSGAFQRRRERGWGRFFTRDDIDRRKPARVTDLLRGIPLLTVEPRQRKIYLNYGWRECEATVWLDGSPLLDSDVDAYVRPEDIAAIEVYREFGTPVEFARPFTCGAIVIWTR
jgi:hypothetical protein